MQILRAFGCITPTQSVTASIKTDLFDKKLGRLKDTLRGTLALNNAGEIDKKVAVIASVSED